MPSLILPSFALFLARRTLAVCLVAVAVVASAQTQPAPFVARTLRLSHQYPTGTDVQGDQRHSIARRFAQEVEKRTAGALKVEIFPSSKLMKPAEEPAALQRGAVDFAIFSVNNMFEMVPDLRITLLPGVIQSYEQAFGWKTAPIGVNLTNAMREKRMLLLTWNWLGAGAVSAGTPIMLPTDVRGMRVRGGGQSVDTLLAAAGAQTLDMPSNQIANAFRERRLDAAFTSASSLLSYQLQSFCHAVTTPRRRALCYFFIPLVASQATLDSLSPDHQRIIREVGQGLEPYARELARADDELLATTYLRANASVVDIDEDQFGQWQNLARVVAWRDFERAVPRGAELLRQAAAVPTGVAPQ